MKLIQDLKEFIGLLNSENVQYLLIGGWAINRYSEPRFTGDIDFFVSDSLENQKRLRIVLKKFGFETTLPDEQNSLFQKPIIMLGRPPNRIDILSTISGLIFDEAYKNKEIGDLDGIKVSFISREDLIKNKTASARPKDLLDVQSLTKNLALTKKTDLN